MKQSELVELLFLIKLFGRKYNDFQFILPNMFWKKLKELDCTVQGFGPYHCLFNIPEELNRFWSTKSIDQVWLRHGVDLKSQTGIKYYLRQNVLYHTMPLDISNDEDFIKPYGKMIKQIIQIAFSMYNELVINSISNDEIRIINRITDDDFAEIHNLVILTA